MLSGFIIAVVPLSPEAIGVWISVLPSMYCESQTAAAVDGGSEQRNVHLKYENAEIWHLTHSMKA